MIRIDFDKEANPDIIADLNKPLPIDSEVADNVFLFNYLCYSDRPSDLLREINRILKKGGRLFLTAEFVKSEETSVSDLWRFTSRNLKNILVQCDFEEIQINQIGDRFCALGNLADFALGNFFLIRILKIFFRFFCLALDKLSPKILKKRYPCPICWFAIARK